MTSTERTNPTKVATTRDPSQVPPADAVSELEGELDLVFAPLHKRCLGVAVGTALGALICAVTAVHVVRSPGEPYPLVLLQQYFPRYEVTWTGAAIGLFWGFWLGFVLGWSFAFLRNLALAITAFLFRARAELHENRGFLDHI